MPRRGEGGEVPAGAPGDEAACGARWPRQQLDDPPQRLVFGVDSARSRLPDPGEHVRRAGNEVEGHGGGRRGGRGGGGGHWDVLWGGARGGGGGAAQTAAARAPPPPPPPAPGRARRGRPAGGGGAPSSSSRLAARLV